VLRTREAALLRSGFERRGEPIGSFLKRVGTPSG
jgi:hypothetical protein